MAKHGKQKHKQHGRTALGGQRPAAFAPSVAVANPADGARRGLDAFERGELGLAIQLWSQTRRAGGPERLDLASAEAHFRRALAATTEGRRSQELREAVALAPDRAIYQYHLGLALHRQGQLRPAIQAYQTACRLDPGNHRYRRHLMLARLEASAPDEPHADTLIEPLAGDESAIRLAALAALRRQEPGEAESALSALKDGAPLTELVRGAAQRMSGQVAAAMTSFGQARAADAPHASAVRSAATIGTIVVLRQAGELGVALDLLQNLDLPTDDATRRAVATVARGLGQDFLLEPRPDAALEALEQALKADPRHEPTRRLVGHLHEVLATEAARAEAYDTAAQHWQAALAGQPGQTRIVHNLALAAEHQEDWEQAAAHWEELIGLWKRELRGARRNDEGAADMRRRLMLAHRRLADAHDANDDLGLAIRAIERALNLDPTDLDLRSRAADLALENEQYGVVIGHLRRMLAVRPDDLRTLVNLGTAYDLNGDDRQAQTLIERALTLEPGHPAALNALATVYHERSHRLFDSGQFDAGIAEMQRAVDLEPGTTRHLECLGEMCLSRSDLVAAKRAFDRAVAVDPDDIKLRVRVGEIYLGRGYEKEAQQRFRQILRTWPGPITQGAIGLAYARVGQMQGAHRYFKHVVAMNDATSLQILGKALNDMHRELDAERYLDRAAKLDPTSARIQVDLAWVYAFGHRDYDRAEAKLNWARPLAEAAGQEDILREIEVASLGLAGMQRRAEMPFDDELPVALPPGLFR